MVFIQNNPEIALHIRDSIMILSIIPEIVFLSANPSLRQSPLSCLPVTHHLVKNTLEARTSIFSSFYLFIRLMPEIFFFNNYTIPSYKAKSNTFRQKLFDMRFTQIILYKFQNYVKIV